MTTQAYAAADNVDAGTNDPSGNSDTARSSRPLGKRLLMLARRTHMYAGLFLLPWVFLYGITGAMFNHQGLFPRATITQVPEPAPLTDFPAPTELANQVASAISQASESKVELLAGAEPTFTNNLMFETQVEGEKHVIHLHPETGASRVMRFPPDDFKAERLVHDVHNISLPNNPQATAQQSAAQVLKSQGLKHNGLRPFGWTKLNFLATVDGEPARVTYVLKDGHVDVFAYDGKPDMSARAFFLRLHTTHGQSPSWTGRMIWSLCVDAMAIAMVTWGFTGLLMWWQIKRTRKIGAMVMIGSVAVGVAVYLAVHHFYAANML